VAASVALTGAPRNEQNELNALLTLMLGQINQAAVRRARQDEKRDDED